MLEVFDRASRKRVAILENAFGVNAQKKLNVLHYLNFSLPYDDPKNEYCKPFHFVRHDDGQLYRIMDDGVQKTETGEYTYKCEHVIATLMDKLLFGYHVVGNLGVYTADSIRYILDHQPEGEKHWVLGECEFAHQFEYGWEQETLLSALFSIPQSFADPYIWTYDTNTYPWVLNLKRLQVAEKPGLYIRNTQNLLNISRERTRTTVCTRLYPLGYGEGVNQLGIAEINDGVPYLQSPQEYIDKYGIIERAWVDRRYENAESLKAAAQAMLNELQEPVEAYQTSMADLVYVDDENTAVEPGVTVRIIDTELGIDKKTILTEVNVTYGDVQSSTITIANRSTDIASTVADMADRQRIEMTYSQGATQIYSQSLQENADSENGLVMDFSIPAEMRIINKVLCKVRVESFRTYSKSTESAARTVSTSDDGGGFNDTTESGGGIFESDEVSTLNSAKVNATSHEGGGFYGTTPSMLLYGSYDTSPADGSVGSHVHSTGVGNHEHTIEIAAHFHTVPIEPHKHQLKIPAHKHQIEIPEHSHTFTLEGHSHDIQAGIFRFGNPKSFKVLVNDDEKASFAINSEEVNNGIDLTDFLIDEETGKITRGTWQSLEIRPDDLAYIKVSLMVQGFVQSRGDAVV